MVIRFGTGDMTNPGRGYYTSREVAPWISIYLLRFRVTVVVQTVGHGRLLGTYL
jgi:hypothetical protein